MKTLSETQRLWLEELINGHKLAAKQERRWAKYAPFPESVDRHKQNAVDHTEFAELLSTLLEGVQNG